MKYLCLKCGEIYVDRPFKQVFVEGKKYIFCPKRNCNNGLVVEIDEFMVDVIKILNEKGYPTKFCCGGHVGNSSSSRCYIVFENSDIFKAGLPKGFRGEFNESRKDFPIRKNLIGDNDIETSINILENYKILIDWVYNLKPNPNIK